LEFHWLCKGYKLLTDFITSYQNYNFIWRLNTIKYAEKITSQSLVTNNDGKSGVTKHLHC
jgi:hypothetical protein